jgi:hypothetical protein
LEKLCEDPNNKAIAIKHIPELFAVEDTSASSSPLNDMKRRMAKERQEMILRGIYINQYYFKNKYMQVLQSSKKILQKNCK